MKCRIGCGACCIAPSISSPIPGMPNGKPAGVRCVQLDDDNLCRLFGKPERPQVCGEFSADKDVCGDTRDQAIILLTSLEEDTHSG
ncbi:YkgJ family cysteine cluster protein [Idiomarina aminovorans]|uniref:YkgJ family cysteine cluster protein n=1 Tax=Idiomarina aminovorans TaxID=2914829 RepID=UPI002002EC34|nr:YkgJ family cysteine cluster protein [Idiomarina sp. ATCH4]MCK7458820.1 YkgJ family cysteine cluster protein [Idiomarina sp. ATCH4]